VARTSGVAGTLQYTVAETVDEAFRRCGKLPSTVSAEQLESARFNLFQILTGYANNGLSLWCVRDYVLPQVEGRNVYTLPSYLTDVLAVQYQRYALLTPASVDSALGLLTLTFSDKTNPQVLNVTGGAATTDIVLEYLDDTGAWVAVAPLLSTEKTLSIEAEPAMAWRLRNTAGAALSVTAFVLYAIARETPLVIVNRDDYLSQPTKLLKTSGEAQQYWFRKATPPQLAFTWSSDSALGGYRVTAQRQIQDITSLSQLLDCPQRWYGAVTAKLAAALIRSIPADEVPPGRDGALQLASAEADADAEGGESDGSPIRLVVGIRGYT
jgi:hypothetical protein